MATTIEEIVGYLDELQILHATRPEYNDIITVFSTEHYLNEDGEHKIPIFILLEDEGRFLKIFAYNCYEYHSNHHIQEFFQALLTISFHTKMVQFECDPHGKGIHAMVEFPLEDSSLTQLQLKRALFSIVHVIEKYDAVIRRALKTGVIHFGDNEEAWLDSFIELISKTEKQQLQSEQEEDSSEEWI